MQKTRSWILVVLILLSACKEEKEIPEEILDQPVALEVLRFDKEFAETTPESLPQ
ncbi:MAG: gliding motility lipoprotein GldB, partial [Flavobacteriaceae bacterium]|nr:gliding motility lipoprotein GldB [Flavobacteriaceae bacterium]